jgi:hypothetical protein
MVVRSATIPWLGSGSMQLRREALKESVSLAPLRSKATWENGVEHSGSRGFADTEEVTGSNPVAPTRHNASTDLPLGAACQQTVSRSLLVTARTL